MILGFTGRQDGMTERQRATVGRLFRELGLKVLHHGGCIGADTEAHEMALVLRAAIRIHPGTDRKKYGDCPRAVLVYPARPNLARNLDIVLMGEDGLVAAPRDEVEVLRSGTWATIRYARKMKRVTWIVSPDGGIKVQ